MRKKNSRKKSKPEIKNQIQKIHQTKATELLLRDDYKKDIKEIEALFDEFEPIIVDNETPENIKIHFYDNQKKRKEKLKAFRKKYGVDPHSIDQLHQIENKGNLKDNLVRIVRGEVIYRSNPGSKEGYEMIDDGFLDENDYLQIKIKPDTSRYIIHYLIDECLDFYQQDRPNKQKKTRFRKERIDALKVWEERRLRKSFPQIAKELGIKEPAAKKRFLKAYEIIYGKKYNPTDFEKPKIKKEYLKRTCETCPKRSTCTDLCPDVIEFVEQDTTYLREKLT